MCIPQSHWFNTLDEMAYSERFTLNSNIVCFIEQRSQWFEPTSHNISR